MSHDHCRPPLVCLITPGHVASAPRLVKSADALVASGYRVHVVAGAPFPPADILDSAIISGAKWGYSRANTRTGAAVFVRKAARGLAREICSIRSATPLNIVARAQFAESVHLARVAAGVHASLFVGHSISALYAAATAARICGSQYGFDIEDYHDAETDEAIADPIERLVRYKLQSLLLPGCHLLTCAAPMIADKYREVYRVDPTTVLNVFPRSQSPDEPYLPKAITDERPAVFYWFSQTIGHGRGLEDTIRVMGKMRTPTQLHLRGFHNIAYANSLQTIARNAGLKRPIVFLEPGPPNEMARLASTADIGLSVETGSPENHDRCLGNKIFVYLMAGIPQLLSDTAAQSAFAPQIGEAALLGNMDRPDETAAIIDSFFSDPERVARARQAAWKLARTRFCWDLEQNALLGLMKALLPLPK